ncbi:E3 ubiquitin-protein ligase UPL1 isoform X1 [Cryptomeria japonica]|uniref:E3 ubiquitin-protein ligase UPL1 isoform X1 n=1 Tax=Cryptomeria japonica TaxID=3369 RepID=UPI0027DA83C0|nr:E3 ubiquitin-protein ligase UPL1 isoform X1 [Cryptomeria japonica]
MKFKKRRGTEAPPKVRTFINNVISVPFENIELPLKTFVWEYEKGDFNHWIELFNHFDSFFDKYVKPRKDLQLDDDFQEADAPFPRLAILQILRVSRTILENCTNKHFYCSYEQHLSSLLASSDADVVIASLQTLAAFVKKPVGKCPIRDTSLNAKLFALSQGWGGKEEGLGLLACSTENGPDLVGYRLGSALHFEFYVDESVKKGDSGDEELRSTGLQVIHIPDMSMHPESDIQLLKHLIDEYKVPTGLRFSLLTRLRFARSFSRLDSRRLYICIRLLAFTVLVQASNDANDLTAFFTNEPEFVNELVSLVRFDDAVPEDIRILAILALTALYQDRSRQTTVLNVITSGGHRGILPSLMQKAISSISSGSADCSISFLEALLSLVTVLVSSSSGCSALRDVGLMPTLLPLLKNLNTQHIHLVTAAVHVLEAFMDYSNPAAISFRDLGGLDNTIARLKLEVCRVEEGTWKETAEIQLHGKGKAPISDASVSEVAQTVQSETLVPYHRRLLMKALLRAISLGTYAPGNTARLYGSEDSALPFCLCTIFRRAKDFGGGVFSLAATVMSDLIHKDPTCYSVLDSAGLPDAFLGAILAGVLPSAEAVSCIPQCLDALCLNNLGLQAISERGALKCFVKIFTSKIYLRALANDTPGSLSTALDELMRHAASLRGPGVDVLIEILNTIAKIGSAQETPSLLQDSAGTSVPMETDFISVDGEESSSATPEQAVDVSADSLSSNMEAFLPDCISNATRLLENILHNTDTCGVFIEKKGIEAVLQLFDLPLLPLSFASGQNIAVAFKNFSPQHSSPLTRAVCTALRDHLKPALQLADSLAGTKLADVEVSERMRILRCFSSLEGVLSFSTHLLKSTTTMMPELGSGDADILKDVGKVYKEVLWQISLVNDAKKEIEQAPTAVNASGSEVTNDASTVSVVRYVNPVSMRNGPSSGWGIDPEFLSVIHAGEGLHRHSRRDHGVDSLSRMRLGRLGRQADSSDIDIGGSVNAAETSQSQESKRKSPDFLDFETISKVATAMRSFYVNLVKVLVVPNRRRDDTGSLSGAAKSVVVSLAKLFNESLDVEKNWTFSEFELSLSTKCRYLGKVVDDMAAVIYDNRRRMCNTAVVNYFYSHGTIQKLLTTFEATGQLLWSVPVISQPGMETENEKENGNDKMEHAPWLLETLRSYCKLLEHLVNSSLLLTTNSSSQLLVQPVVGASFQVPRDPEVFVRTIQAQVLCAVLPIWNHPMFCRCNPSLITSVVSIITHVYSGTGDAKGNRNGVPGSSAQRFRGHPPDETSISMIVDMGFPRSRAEEALRRVETNSVEMAMEWLFNHPEEPAQEDDELAQALALSLGKPSEAPKDESSEKGKEVLNEEKLPENPPVEDILSTCMNMLQSTDAIAFSMTDLIVTLCCQNKGQYRLRVVPYLVQHLKLWKVDGTEKDNSPVSTISHLLALVLSEDSSAREVAAENCLVSTALDLLTNFSPKNVAGEKISVPKWVTALLLVLDHMLQCKLQLASDTQNTTGTGSHANTPEDNSAGMSTANNTNKSPTEENNKESSPFMEILGRPSGYMTTDEQQKAMNIACDYLQLHLPATTVQSVLQLCARLTKSHSMAIKFLERGGLASLLSLPRSSFFPGFDSVAAAIIRHLLEDPQTLQIAMEVEIRQTLINILNRHGGRVSPRTFLTSMAPVISREPTIFMQTAAVVCQLETVGGRPNIILSKEREDKEKGKEKEKVKEKDKEKDKSKTSCNTEACVPSGDVGRVHDGIGRPHDGLAKTPKGHKKIPHSFTQVIDQLLEVILHYPPPSQGEECTGSTMAMEVDEVAPKEKGKAKIEDTMNSESDNVPDSSAGLAKVAFILKLMSDILLMYIHAAGVVLRRDSESSQGRGPCQGAEVSGHGGLLYHVLHRLLPYPMDKTSESNSEEWREKLSEKASWFLVVICGRSSEGRKRVISEIVRALNMASNSVKGSSKHVQLPNKKVLAFVELVNSILSNNASSGNTQVPGCSPDMAKTMIDTAMVQALTSTLQVIDLDHPDAPKLVNLILKALEALTRAASTGEQIYKSEDTDKKKTLAAEERNHGGTNRVPSGEETQAQQNEINQGAEQHTTGMAQRQVQIAEGSSDPASDQAGNVNEHMEHDMRIEREDTAEAHNSPVHGEEFIHGTVEVTTDLHNSTTEVSFRVEHRADDEMGDEEDDEDMDDDVEEEDEDEDEDEEDDIEGEEGTAHMSLADTDVEDHEDNGLGDDYGDDMVEEDDDDDFPENRVIEVRWREGLDGLNHVQVLGHAGGGGNLVDLSAEPFQGIHMEDIFGLRRPAGVDRRRPTGHRPFPERPGLDRGGAFQHPLLTRPAQSGGATSNGSIWATSGNISRDSAAISGGSFDVAQFFMYDAPMLLPPDHSGGAFFGDRGVGGPPPLLDFSMDPIFLTGRRGPGNGRWTDDGQPQAGAQAASIAQAVEEEFLSQLRSLTQSIEESPSRQAVVPSTDNADGGQQTTAAVMETDVQPNLPSGNPSGQQIEEHQMGEADLSQVQQNASVEHSEQRHPDFDVDGNRDDPDVLMRDEGNEAGNRDLESESQDSEGSGATMGESLRSLEVETGSADGREETERQGANQTLAVSTAENSDARGNSMDAENINSELRGADLVGQERDADVDQSHTTADTSVHLQAQNEAAQGGNNELAERSGEGTRTNTIDPTFLEALPEDLRAEVLASQQVQSARAANYTPPPAEDIDPEFLAALPPDIQAEVLAQQRAQRVVQSQQAEGQPVDMDSASIIATFPAELREEVLLTSSEAVLAALSPALLAEAQMLRERAMSQYQHRGFLGAGHRLGGRRHNIGTGGQALERGVGNSIGLTLGRRPGTSLGNAIKMKEVEGKALVDTDALKAMLQLLRLAQPLGKGLLQRLLLNLCAHVATRATLVHLLLDMLRPEAEGFPVESNGIPSQRLYGCQWNVVYARSQLSDDCLCAGVPPLVSRRVLEILTYLAKNHFGVADLLFFMESCPTLDAASQTPTISNGEKGKGKILDEVHGSHSSERTESGEIPLILLLKLLNQPLFSRSSAHLEQLMGLLEVVMNNVGVKSELEAPPSHPQDVVTQADDGHVESEPLPETGPNVASAIQTGEPASLESNDDAYLPGSSDATKPIEGQEASASGSKKEMDASEVLLQLPQRELQNLCKLLAKEGLSDTVYTKVAEVLKKLASIALTHRKLFISELADSAHNLSGDAVGELVTLRDMELLGGNACSMAGAAILRVLQALSTLTSDVGTSDDKEHEILSVVRELNMALDPLWQGLSVCISKIEQSLGNASEVSASASRNAGATSVAPPLPPGTQRVLPFIEAFFVLCEKLQLVTSAAQHDSDDASTSDAAQLKKVEGGMTFVKFADKHRRLLNAFVRQHPGLLEKSLSLMLKTPRLIDFDNKRSFFRSRIRQQNEQHNYNPLRICVRRTYVLEDSYSQLRMRSVDDIKGRLTVQFQGEEGIDAGGLTREWYQLLSRVIFDKGALLFTTVGNESTFQPNPNSVYQTEHLSYFKFVGRVVAKALFDGQLLDVHFTRSFYKHILGVRVAYHDIEAIDPDYFKNLKWMLENDISDILDLTFSIDADEEKRILYEKTEVTDYELISGGRNIRVTDENKHQYVDLVAEHILTNAIRSQINAFMEGFNELIPRHLISIFNDKELELLISGLPEIDLDDLKSSTEYTGYTSASPVIQWFWEVVQGFGKEDMARLLQFVTGTSKVPLEGFKALQGISGPQRFQIHKAYGAPERLPSAHTCFNQLDLPEYSSKEQLQERLLLAIHEASEGFGFG